MKVLLVVPSLQCGGAQRVASVLSLAWEAAGHEPVVCIFNGAEQHYEAGGRLLDLRRPPEPSYLKKSTILLERAGDLCEVLRRERPDRIVSLMETANFPTILAAMRTRMLARLVVSIRNNPAETGGVMRWLCKLLYRFPSRVVVGSVAAEAIVRDELWLKPAQVRSIPNPLQLGTLSTQALQTPELSPDISAGRYVLAVGRLVPVKGFDLLIRAFAKACKGTDVSLLILGEGPERAALQALASVEGVSDQLRMPGRVANPAAFMARAELGVLSSRREGWPNVLIEAMAVGLPMIAFACEFGPPEILAGGECGLLVPPGEVDGLAEAMRRMLDDPALREGFKAQALERSASFDAQAIAARWLD